AFVGKWRNRVALEPPNPLTMRLVFARWKPTCMNSLWAASRMRRVTMAGWRATMSCAGPRFRVSVPMGFVNKAGEIGTPMAGYVRNVWYMAAWESEIEDSELLTRALLDEARLVLMKADRSGYALLDDRCPHRFAPLSMGKRNGDLISCCYHGL